MTETNDTTQALPIDGTKSAAATPSSAVPLRGTVRANEWGGHVLTLPGIGQAHLSRIAEVEELLDQYRPQIMQAQAAAEVTVDFLLGRTLLGDTHEQRFVEGRTWEEHEPFSDEVEDEYSLPVTSQVLLTRPLRHGAGEQSADQDRATCLWVIRDRGSRQTQRVELRSEELDWLRRLLDRRRDLCEAGSVPLDTQLDREEDEDRITRVTDALARAWRNHPSSSLGELLDRLQGQFDRQQDERGGTRALSWTSISDDAVLALADELDEVGA